MQTFAAAPIRSIPIARSPAIAPEVEQFLPALEAAGLTDIPANDGAAAAQAWFKHYDM